MSLLGGGIQALFGQVFSGLYLDGVWIKSVLTDDGKGGFSKATTEYPIKYQPDDFSDYHRNSAGIPASDVRVLVLQHGVEFVPIKDDRFRLVNGLEYAVVSFTSDPAQSYWRVHGTRVGGA